MPMSWLIQTMQHANSSSDECPCSNLMMTNDLNGIDNRVAGP